MSLWGQATKISPLPLPRSISQTRYDLYRHVGDTQFPIHPPRNTPSDLGALMNIVWPPFPACPIWPSPSDPSCNRWFPPFISDDTPRTELLASACFDLGRERGEQVEELEKRTVRAKRRRREGKRGGRGKGKKEDPGPTDVDSTTANGGAGPDSKLEKICSESLDWDPGEIALQLSPFRPLSPASHYRRLHYLWCARGTPKEILFLLTSPPQIFHLDLIPVLSPGDTIGPRDLSVTPLPHRQDHFGSRYVLRTLFVKNWIASYGLQASLSAAVLCLTPPQLIICFRHSECLPN